MNALVGREAKVNCSLFGSRCEVGADDGGSNDGGDLVGARTGRHLGR